MTDHPTRTPARELTPEEAEDRRVACKGLDAQVVAALRDGRHAAWDLARALHEFDEEAGWSGLGFDTLADWLRDVDEREGVPLSESEYHRMIGRWRIFGERVPEDRLRELPPSKLDVVLSAVRANPATRGDALADVERMSRRELRAKYQISTGAGPSADLQAKALPPAPVAEPEVEVQDDDEATVQPKPEPVDPKVKIDTTTKQFRQRVASNEKRVWMIVAQLKGMAEGSTSIDWRYIALGTPESEIKQMIGETDKAIAALERVVRTYRQQAVAS